MPHGDVACSRSGSTEPGHGLYEMQYSNRGKYVFRLSNFRIFFGRGLQGPLCRPVCLRRSWCTCLLSVMLKATAVATTQETLRSNIFSGKCSLKNPEKYRICSIYSAHEGLISLGLPCVNVLHPRLMSTGSFEGYVTKRHVIKRVSPYPYPRPIK